jgi:predicted PurR-regulated permease PerM
VKRNAIGRDTSRLFFVVTALLIVAALYFARVVFIPLAVAVLLTVLLTPAITALEKIRVPRIFAIFLVVLILFGLAGVAGWKASQQLTELTYQLPGYKKTLEDKIRSLKRPQSKTFEKASATVKELANEFVATTPGSTGAATNTSPGSSTSKPMAVEIVPPTNTLESVENIMGPVATIGVIVIFTVFMLAGREDLRNRFIRLAGGGQLNVMTQALDEATYRINRYLFLQLAVNTAYGILVGVTLHFIGLPNASLWGVSAGILRFVPYAGPPLAALMPVILSLALFPGWHQAVETTALFVVLELVVSNFIEPLLYGAHVGLSALAILVAAVFWTLIWGFPGLILATPLTVCLVVLGRYVPSLGFLNILLGDEPVMPPRSQFYQRLLAGDQGEAREIMETFLKDHSLEALYSEVVIPALALAEYDRHRNELDAETESFVFQSTRELVEELGDLPAVEPDHAAESIQVKQQLRVVCVPARDDADDVVAMLLSQLLEREGYNSESIPVGTMGEMLSAVEDLTPDIVFISALPPFAFNHARTLYHKLRIRMPKLDIAICVWGYGGDLTKGQARLKTVRGHVLLTTLEQATRHLHEQIELKVAVE